MEKVFLEELTESKTFTVDAKGKRFAFSKSTTIINGNKTVIAQWKLDGEIVLEICTNIPGMWRILRDGRKGYIFEPSVSMDRQFIVLLLQ